MKKSVFICVSVFCILLILGIAAAVIWNSTPSTASFFSLPAMLSQNRSSDIEIDVHGIAFCRNPKDVFPDEPYFKHYPHSPSDGNTFAVASYTIKNNGKHSKEIVPDCGTVTYSDGYEYSANTFSGISEVIEKGSYSPAYLITLNPLCSADCYAVLELPVFVEENSEEPLLYSLGGITYRVR